LQAQEKEASGLQEGQVASFMPKWEPNSPAKLYEKTHQLAEDKECFSSNGIPSARSRGKKDSFTNV